MSIVPPDESGAVTISGYGGVPADATVLKKLLTSPFARCKTKSPIAKEARNDWEGYTQEFVCADEGGRQECIGTVAQKGRSTVFITVNSESRRMPEKRSIYLRIMQSLQVFEPEKP